MLMTDLLGYLAGALLLMMTFSNSQPTTRNFNIAVNARFIAYGLLAHVGPILILNSIMLMVHAYRIFQIKVAKSQQVCNDWNGGDLCDANGSIHNGA